jgi:hypothetical protein
MSTSAREDVIARAVTDADFRARLLADPEGTLAAEGYDVPAEFVAQIKAIDPADVAAATGSLDAAFADRKAAA